MIDAGATVIVKSGGTLVNVDAGALLGPPRPALR